MVGVRVHRYYKTHVLPLNDAIARGVTFINSISERRLNYIWIEKVSYASPLLTDAYVLAALKAAASPPGPFVGRSLWPEGYMTHLDKYVKNFHETPLCWRHGIALANDS